MKTNKAGVLLFFPHYDSAEQSSSLRSSQIGKFLSQKGYNVTVIAPGVDLRTQRLFPEVRGKCYVDSVVDGVRVLRPWCLEGFRKSIYHRFFFEVLFSLWAIFLSFKTSSKPDIIIGAYPPAILPSIGLMIAKLRGIPYVFEVRDLMADALAINRYSTNRIFNKIAKVVENMVYRKANHIVTVSEGIKKAVIKTGIPANKITPVKNGYEPQIFKNPDRSLNPRRYFGWGDKFVVIYAGGLTQSYDIPTLLRTAERTKEDKGIFYAIIGDGEKKKHYQSYCRQKCLQNVQFYEPKPRKMMPHILAAADVGVHLFPDDPLWDYVLGNKPFDYLGSGLPMIYSGRGDTADLVIKAGAGFVVHPEKPQELAEKIIWLKEHSEEAQKMGENGKKYVKTHCDRFELLKPMDAVIQEVLRG